MKDEVKKLLIGIL